MEKFKHGKNKKPKIMKWFYKHLWVGLGVVIGICLMVVVFFGTGIWFSNRPLPGVKLAGTEVGNLSKKEIVNSLPDKVLDFGDLTLVYGDREWKLDLKELNWSVDTERSAEIAIDWGKSWNEWLNVYSSLKKSVDLNLKYKVNVQLLENKLTGIATEIYIPAILPEVTIENGRIKVFEGVAGKRVAMGVLKSRIKEFLGKGKIGLITIPVEAIGLQISTEEQSRLMERAVNLVDKSIVLSDDKDIFKWQGLEMVQFLKPNDEFDRVKILSKLELISKKVNIEMEDAVFVFDEDTNRVREFKPEAVGKLLNEKVLVDEIVEKLKLLSAESGSVQKTPALINIKLIYEKIYPNIRVADINQLGIEELLGKGVSTYKHSIAGRKYNVALGADRIGGTLVKPGGIFSFNNSVGEVSAATGYKKSYVIRSGETVLDDGGGLCQVSTTVFRAVLNAGLPIVERKAHSYRVGYYEQDSKPGLDATVYAPSVDLKFMNDTPAYILVQTRIDETIPQLIVEIYGTSDGRRVELGNERVWGISAPPDDLYVDDPTLFLGKLKQIEYKAWGAKAAFDWKVVRDDEVLQERTFYSNYRPWGAVYLRGTK